MGFNKYKNVRTRYGDRLYHSKAEARYAEKLDWLVKAGGISKWKAQPKLSIEIEGIWICNYTMDFLVFHNDGTEEWVEVKGFETPEWGLKWRLTKALWYKLKPGAKLTLKKV